MSAHSYPQGLWDIAAVAALLGAEFARGGATPDQRPVGAGLMDVVTGLMNRAAFTAAAAEVFMGARRAGAPVSVLMVDVDGLKAINIAFGADAGDKVLAHVAQLLALNIQPGVDLAARYTGAELALLLPEADYAWASAFAERLRGVLANRPVRHGAELINLSASFGVASITPADGDVGALVARARAALCCAKTGGRNQVQVAQGQTLAAA